MSQQPDFTIAEFLAFVRSKPADKEYDYNDFQNCAICQFLKDTGRCADPAVSNNHWRDRNWENSYAQRVYFDVAIERAACGEETFGALAERLSTLLPAEPNTPWAKLSAYAPDGISALVEECVG